MNNVAMIIGPSAPERHDIARAVMSTRLFQHFIHCTTEQQVTERLQEQQVDIVCCPFPSLRSALASLINRLRERDEWHDIPLLLFTAESKQSNRISALELGASDCLPLDLQPRQAAVQIGWHLKHKHRIEQLRRSEADLVRKAVTDSLTGLFNRGYFDADLDQKIALAQRTGRPLTLLLADLDHFKAVNDSYGHQAGDYALQSFAELMRQSARKSDVLCRYGGEEFAVILPECDSSQAFQAAERLRERVAGYDFGFPLTVSIGIATTTVAWRHAPRQLLEHADSALYNAKEKGRNRTEIFPPSSLDGVSTQAEFPYPVRCHKTGFPQALRRSIAALCRAARYSFG